MVLVLSSDTVLFLISGNAWLISGRTWILQFTECIQILQPHHSKCDLSPCCPVQIYHLFLVVSALTLYSEQIKMMMIMMMMMMMMMMMSYFVLVCKQFPVLVLYYPNSWTLLTTSNTAPCTLCLCALSSCRHIFCKCASLLPYFSLSLCRGRYSA